MVTISSNFQLPFSIWIQSTNTQKLIFRVFFKKYLLDFVCWCSFSLFISEKLDIVNRKFMISISFYVLLFVFIFIEIKFRVSAPVAVHVDINAIIGSLKAFNWPPSLINEKKMHIYHTHNAGHWSSLQRIICHNSCSCVIENFVFSLSEQVANCRS